MWAERGRYPVSMMARLLGVSRSGYYSWLDAGGHLDPLAGLKDVVAALWEGSGRTFGWRRVKAELPPEWSGASGYSVLKSMRELGLRGFRPRSSKRTTISDPDAPARPDLVRRRFNPPVPTTVLCGDITYLRTGEGWLYLASVVDLSTRMVVGWSFSARMTADICVSALEMAQNSERLVWTAEEVDHQLHKMMENIHKVSAEAAAEYGLGYDLVAGANIAGFKKVAEAMMEQGCF